MPAAAISPAAKYTAECLGTFLLVFTVGSNVYSGSGAFAATSIACVLMVAIYSLAGVSGAHLNPAVTAAVKLAERLQGKTIDWREVAGYVTAQLVGGLVAGLACMPWGRAAIGPKTGAVEISWWQCCLAEFLFTSMLAFVILNVACARRNQGGQYFGLSIGFVIVAGGYAVGGISGGCFNPAVALGIGFREYLWVPVYWLAEVAGAAAAVGLYQQCRPDEFQNTAPTEYPMRAKAVSEAVGTFYLVLTVELNVTGSSAAPVWSIAASLMCMIFSLGSCSGAHFNPAVTVAILGAARNKIAPRAAGVYVAAQILGGILGAFTSAALMRGAVAVLGPGDGFSWTQAAAAELAFTTILCFTVLNVATVDGKELTQYFGLAIASCVTVGGFAIGKISGGSLNPAVSIGISAAELLDGGKFWQCIPYSVAEVLGGALAAGLFYGTRPSEYPKGLPVSESISEQC